MTLVGIADPQAQGGGAAISSVAAKLAATGNPRPLDTAPAPGFSGAAAIDAQGRPLGMVVLKTPVVAGPAQAPQAAVMPLERVINFLEAQLRRAVVRPAGRRTRKARWCG